MPHRTYMGSYREVDVLLPDGKTLHAVRGEETDVSEVPADVLKELDEQGQWIIKKPKADDTASGGKE